MPQEHPAHPDAGLQYQSPVNEPELLGEISDSRTWGRNIQDEPEHLVIPESKEALNESPQ